MVVIFVAVVAITLVVTTISVVGPVVAVDLVVTPLALVASIVVVDLVTVAFRAGYELLLSLFLLYLLIL